MSSSTSESEHGFNSTKSVQPATCEDSYARSFSAADSAYFVETTSPMLSSQFSLVQVEWALRVASASNSKPRINSSLPVAKAVKHFTVSATQVFIYLYTPALVTTGIYDFYYLFNLGVGCVLCVICSQEWIKIITCCIWQAYHSSADETQISKISLPFFLPWLFSCNKSMSLTLLWWTYVTCCKMNQEWEILSWNSILLKEQ